MNLPEALVALGITAKTRKVKHRKLTAEGWAVLEREADLRAKTRKNKQIAAELGLDELYVAHTIARLVSERRGLVPRLTHSFALPKDRSDAKIQAPEGSA